MFSAETATITTRRCARLLHALYAPNEGAGVRTRKASEQRRAKVCVDALARSEIFGGEVGEEETPLEAGAVVLAHPFGETVMEAERIHALTRADLHDHRIGDGAPTDSTFAILTRLRNSLHCTGFLSFTSVINVIAGTSDDANALKSTDATATQRNIKKNIGVELATMRKKSLSFPRNSPIRLEDCLDFCTVVDSTEVCSFCHHGGKEDLDQRITVLPPILVFLLKRFSYNANLDGRSPLAGYRSKITDFVEFPLEGLDLSGYSLSPVDAAPAVYDLICVCNHSGTADFGHYYAYCRECVKGAWRWAEYNDEYVREMRASEVQTANAYMLFYRRHDLGVKELGDVGVKELGDVDMKELGDVGVKELGVGEIEARAAQEAGDLEIAMREQELEEQEYERRNLAMSIDLNLKEAEAGGCVVMT